MTEPVCDSSTSVPVRPVWITVSWRNPPGLCLVGDAFPRQHLGQAPVHHEDLAKAADHDIRGLQVAVDDTPDVSVGHRQADLLEDAQEPRLLLSRARAVRQQNSQGAALDQLHGEIRPLIGEGAELVDRDHSGVLQLAGDLGLLDEPADQVGPLLMLLEQDLDGQVATEVAVAPLMITPMPPRATSPSSWSRARGSDASGISVDEVRTTGSGPVNGSVSCKCTRGRSARVSASLASAPERMSPSVTTATTPPRSCGVRTTSGSPLHVCDRAFQSGR